MAGVSPACQESNKKAKESQGTATSLEISPRWHSRRGVDVRVLWKPLECPVQHSGGKHMRRAIRIYRSKLLTKHNDSWRCLKGNKATVRKEWSIVSHFCGSRFTHGFKPFLSQKMKKCMWRVWAFSMFFDPHHLRVQPCLEPEKTSHGRGTPRETVKNQQYKELHHKPQELQR